MLERGTHGRGALAALAAAALLALPSTAAAATDFTVTTTADGGDGTCDATCTLRDAVGDVNDGDTIHLPASPTAYAVNSDLSVTKTVTIAGAGARSTTISGDADNRVLGVNGSGKTVTITGVTITGGNVVAANGLGGGIHVSSGSLAMTDAAVVGNHVSASTGNAAGGGIRVAPGLGATLTNVIVAGNTATTAGGIGSIATGGGIENFGATVTLVNSTVSGNSLSGPKTRGGGIWTGSQTFMMPNQLGATTLTSSTVLGNTASGSSGRGGNLNTENSATVTLKGTIVSGGVASAEANCAPDGGSFASQGGNLDSVDECGLGATELRNTVPNLGPLGDHGGPTDTHALAGPSAVVDGAGACGQATDQRGLPRLGPCDVGALENQPPAATATAPATGAIGVPVAFDASGSSDPEGGSLGFSWAFDDGAGGLGASVSHAFAAAGAHGGTVTVSDPAGASSSATAPVAISSIPLIDVAPVLAGLTLVPSAFPAARTGPSARAAARRRRYGARVFYRLSEPATTRFTVERPRPGRRLGRRCVAPTRRNRTARRCIRYVRVRGSFSRRGGAGSVRFRFMGRIGGRRLAVGRYRLVAVASDATGHRSRPVRHGFLIVP